MNCCPSAGASELVTVVGLPSTSACGVNRPLVMLNAARAPSRLKSKTESTATTTSSPSENPATRWAGPSAGW